MNDLIQRIVNAIIREEGMPTDYTNPGNLRACPWFQAVVVDGKLSLNPSGVQRHYPDGEYVQISDKGFWVPRTRGEGMAGAAHVVALHLAEGNTLAELIAIWAPPTENNTVNYIANVKLWAQVPDENKPLWEYVCS